MFEHRYFAPLFSAGLSLQMPACRRVVVVSVGHIMVVEHLFFHCHKLHQCVHSLLCKTTPMTALLNLHKLSKACSVKLHHRVQRRAWEATPLWGKLCDFSEQGDSSDWYSFQHQKAWQHVFECRAEVHAQAALLYAEVLTETHTRHKHAAAEVYFAADSPMKHEDTEMISEIALNMINNCTLMLAQASNMICGALMLIYGRIRAQKQSNANNNWQCNNKWWNQFTRGHGAKLHDERDAAWRLGLSISLHLWLF